jgi:N-acetylmuramic acid 6-phosphate etherase
MAAARRHGALIISLTCADPSPMAAAADVAIAPVVGPEVLTGSTRLKAGTAQKMVLNMLSTGVMIRLGRTYGNLMVDVQASNAKLRVRAVRIVAQATGLDRAEAEALLAASHNDVKTAIVASLAGISPEEARNRLVAAGGVVRRALSAV